MKLSQFKFNLPEDKIALHPTKYRDESRLMVLHRNTGKIEHRMFSYITKNWRAKPLESLEVIVNLIANTTTQKGLKVKAKVDEKQYEKGIKVEEEELKKIKLTTKDFRGDWNYKIAP